MVDGFMASFTYYQHRAVTLLPNVIYMVQSQEQDYWNGFPCYFSIPRREFSENLPFQAKKDQWPWLYSESAKRLRNIKLTKYVSHSSKVVNQGKSKYILH